MTQYCQQIKLLNAFIFFLVFNAVGQNNRFVFFNFTITLSYTGDSVKKMKDHLGIHLKHIFIIHFILYFSIIAVKKLKKNCVYSINKCRFT